MDPVLIDILVKIGISLLVGLITTFVIPAIAKWKSNTELTKFETLTKNAVNAAEQIFGAGTGETKKEYVWNILKMKFPALTTKLGTSTVDAIIEGFVYEVSGQIKNAIKTTEEVKQEVNSASKANNDLAIISAPKTVDSKKNKNIILS